MNRQIIHEEGKLSLSIQSLEVFNELYEVILVDRGVRNHHVLNTSIFGDSY